MRRVALAMAALALGVAGCGGDDEPTARTVTVTETVTEAPAATQTATEPELPTVPPEREPEPERTSSSCGDVVFSENSGDAAFAVTVEGVTCDQAERLLRSEDGLGSWNCRVIAREPGSQTTSCALGDNLIVFRQEA